MKNILKQIIELQAIRKEKEKLAERENELIKPLLTDFSDIRLVYDIFTNLTQKTPPTSQAAVYEHKSQFTIIVYLLFAPEVLARRRLPRNLRNYISEVLNISKSFISHNIANVLFRYQKTKTYREELDYLYQEILSQLKARGKIQTSC